MIDLKPPEEEKPKNLFYEQLENESSGLTPKAEYSVSTELHEISKTLKEMLREMRKRKV